MIHTQKEFAEHLRTGVKTCLVCGEKLTGEWTDLNGEMRCVTCGMPYQVISWKHGDAWLAEIGINRADVVMPHCVYFEKAPLYRDYWLQTKQRIPLGSYLGQGTSGNNHNERVMFCKWLLANRETYLPDYADLFAWDVVEVMAAKEVEA